MSRLLRIALLALLGCCPLVVLAADDGLWIRNSGAASWQQLERQTLAFGVNAVWINSPGDLIVSSSGLFRRASDGSWHFEQAVGLLHRFDHFVGDAKGTIWGLRLDGGILRWQPPTPQN